jgi:hypothetical protein
MSEPSAPEEPPPFLGSWRRLYWLLIIELAVISVLSYALVRWAA